MCFKSALVKYSSDIVMKKIHFVYVNIKPHLIYWLLFLDMIMLTLICNLVFQYEQMNAKSSYHDLIHRRGLPKSHILQVDSVELI